ncbi:alpha/beta fold hydrolase (plasmid) [Streptomyces sp. CA-142005]|uniref:alpha/beta fold hydrolase n=1 Tax=Streptomyces sp. CA-142005 TaxID=3240052 RepID=UPI003D8CE9AD
MGAPPCPSRFSPPELLQPPAPRPELIRGDPVAVHRVRIGDGHVTSVRDEGAGEPYVLVHGSPLDQRAWDGIMPLLATGARVITYDLRGHGTAASAPPARTRDDFVDDLATLLDQLQITTVHLLGHSFGGQIAQLFAARLTGRTRRLALLCTRATPFPLFADAASVLEHSGLPDPGPILARWFPPEAITADAAPVRYARSCLLRADPGVWASEFRMIAEFDGRDALQAITAPTAVIAAEHDHVASPEAMKDMAGLLREARFHLLEGSYHLAPLLDAARVVALVRGEGPSSPCR